MEEMYLNLQIVRTLVFIAILVLVSVTMISCTSRNMRPAVALNYLAQQIENGELNDIELTIYYISISMLVRFPISADSLLELHDEKIVISSEELGKHIDLPQILTSFALVPARQSSMVDARIYYVFSRNGDVILDVVMWGNRNTNVFVNGREFEWNDVFIDVIEPFLPEEKVARLRVYVGG